MSKKQKKKPRRKPASPSVAAAPDNSASEALTVAWTVSLTTVLLCDLIVLLTAWLINQGEAGDRLKLLHELMLFAAAIVGALSLVLLSIVYRVRREPPPAGLSVFGICLAVAPMLALLVRMLQQ